MGVHDKEIFLSYSKQDDIFASKFRKILNDLFGKEIWLRDFDLNAGDLVIDCIGEAIAEAKWFIILLSFNSVQSKWLKMEADLATFRALNDQNFEIIVLKLDEAPIPPHLKIPFSKLTLIDFSSCQDDEAELLDLADYIDRTETTQKNTLIYVDRGGDADSFSLLTRQNRIIFILGWAGIGKTAFVLNRVSERLKKRVVKISLTRGHSMDLVARQIIRETHFPAPPTDKSVPDEELLNMAISSFEKRSKYFFLFIDNAEEGLDVSNQVVPYLEKLLLNFVRAGIDSHIILSTSRFPEYSPDIAKKADLMRLNQLDNEYIRECIDLWLEGTKNHKRIMKMPEMEDVLELISGHPLAAKMIASKLRVRPLTELIAPTAKKRFQLKFAEYILKEADKDILTKVHLHILYALAIIHEPILFEDLLAIKEISKFPLEDVRQARIELTDWFFIEQNYELMSLHNFLRTYFNDSLDAKKDLFESIALDFGEYAFNKSIELNNKLIDRGHGVTDSSESKVLHCSNELLRYAVPAGILLRATGKEDLANKLPIQIKGTLRELVYYFYQKKRDYGQAILFAEKWLKINPNDLDIILYQARSYRNLRNEISFKKAAKLLAELERRDYGKRFAARVFREKALLAQFSDNIEEAKKYFRQGIEVYTLSPYPENRTGLAQILLKEADELPSWSPQRIELACEARKLLEKAREYSAFFDRYHIGTYIEALFQTDDVETVLPLLEEALEDRPDDKRLNYRLAEILRKRGAYEEAATYANKALQKGSYKAALTLANIFHTQGVIMAEYGDSEGANQKFNKGIEVVNNFIPEYGHDQEVADSIASKIFRAMGNWKDAEKRVEHYNSSRNPYTIYEQCKVALNEVSTIIERGEYDKALIKINYMQELIEKYSSSQELPQPLVEIRNETYLYQKHISSIQTDQI
ncbi:AAA domain-containing protein [Desulfocicer vacuolatum DSM 3385]|uniref:AAA domain-containing protein n=1 Tax=Desulfocicer vacuolatum DSM 3385 TaxID=1121400 RepID=A0A1W2DQE8_9BACT|nr:TIR domain-containing protein [Desulfocicer vacuolatum]SMC99651.1 AAA domain-containing protein [Desulfocicer vacuolatum DSM 3385]